MGATAVTNYIGGPNRDALFEKLLVEVNFGETSEIRLVTDKDNK